MKMSPKLIAAATFGVFVTGCATVDPNFKARVEAQVTIEKAFAEAEKEKARAEQARYLAMQKIGETGDQTAKAVAVMALAMGAGGSKSEQTRTPQPLPAYETDGDRVLKWASVLMPSVTNLGAGYFGYRLGVAQSNNNAATTIAGYNSFSSIANSGFNATTNIANAGFSTASQLGSYIQAPQPNITIGGNGVIGSGTMSTTLSGTGVLGNGTYTGPVTRNCSGGNGAPGGNGAAGGNGTTNGGAGGVGGAGAPGGAANC